MEEFLREAACYGKLDDVRDLVCKGADVNSQHVMNKWTALHWAAKRNHSAVVHYLIESGADKTLKNDSGKTPVDLATERSTLLALGAALDTENGCAESDVNRQTFSENGKSFEPSYLALMKSDGQCSFCHQPLNRHQPRCEHIGTQTDSLQYLKSDTTSLLVVKVRCDKDDDFIEVDLDRGCLTFNYFVDTLCAELGVDKNAVVKIRKCPNTLIRNDRDVSRLLDFQEIELVQRIVCH